MGLPVLTMQGFNFNSRCGESINKNINMDNLIGKDDHDYLNIAISLSKDPNLKEIYGEKLRKKLCRLRYLIQINLQEILKN